MNLIYLMETANSFCQKTSIVWTIFGYIIFAIKVVVPLLLIVSGMITMADAVMKKDEKDIKKAQNTLVQKLIAAVIVFLVIQITSIVVNLVADDSWKGCATCAFHPFSGTYTTTYKDSTGAEQSATYNCGITTEPIMN